ncbi:hypothetical protein [Paraliomyxa miuraensis]|uniref:hypothetical protein n=1 Tax=Paraliomyxa miuraensis TaxID=376150 RepID=UPI002253D52A|nr:hypothetical protein [Paraliomyxa miuraensis]MCX4241845.1 hypothetical protein [Paraliomyxa miuraensis]
MAHNEAETPSPAITPAAAASNRRKRLILLSSEDLRPVVCALEDALRSRGWEVDLELGAAAKPWIQQVAPVRPSLRVLCVPSVDPNLARQLRTAYRPDSDADLHIVGVDRTNGLVQEIERLAGVQSPRPRPLSESPRLAHPTVVESQLQRERRWLVGATSALAVFALTLGGIAMVRHSPRVPELALLPAATMASPVTSPRVEPMMAEVEPETSRFDDPVFAAVTPLASSRWDYEFEDDDDDLVILPDDEFEAEPEVERKAMIEVDVFAPPLAEPSLTIVPSPIEADEPSPIEASANAPLPSGITPMAGVIPDAATTHPARQLPHGFLPVAGLTPPPSIVIDPFEAPADASAPMQTVDPFAALDVTAP